MTDSSAHDDRPAVWIGHVHLDTDRLTESHAFLASLGMRSIFVGDGVAVLELRAGTHLVLHQVDSVEAGAVAGFDLMVDDLEATHRALAAKGLSPSEIEPGRIHRSFFVPDPSGILIKFNSSHNSGQPV